MSWIIIIKWLIVMTILGLLWYLSRRLINDPKALLAGKQYLRLIEAKPLGINRSLQLWQIAEQEYILLAITEQGIVQLNTYNTEHAISLYIQETEASKQNKQPDKEEK